MMNSKKNIVWFSVFVAGFLHYQHIEALSTVVDDERNSTLNVNVPHRKLLLGLEETVIEPKRAGDWNKCSCSSIAVHQGQTTPLPSGIPTYTVIIMNVCPSGCDISGIHLQCGWFSSARLINPKIFKRLSYDDCLVNDGNTLRNGYCLTFTYANSFSYPLEVSSLTCA